MFNVRTLDVKRQIYMNIVGMTSHSVVIAHVTPSEKHNNDVVIKYIHSLLNFGNLHWYGCIDKYNMKSRRNIWSYKLDIKYKSYTSGIETDESTPAPPMIDVGLGDYLSYIEYIDDELFLDLYGTNLCLRSTKTGNIVTQHPYGSLSRKNLVHRDDSGYLLLWDKGGILECYKHGKLCWKYPVTTKPDDSIYDPSFGFILFYSDIPKIIICQEKDGKTSSLPILAPSGIQSWCKTRKGLILANKSYIYHLDVNDNRKEKLVDLPKGHRFVSMRHTNKNYLVITTRTFVNSYYLIYDIAAQKIIHTLPSFDVLGGMNVVGIGDHQLLFARLDCQYQTLSIYDILNKTLTSVPNTDSNTTILPSGDNHIICHDLLTVRMIG